MASSDGMSDMEGYWYWMPRIIRGKEVWRWLQWKLEFKPEGHSMCPNCVTPWKCNGPHISSEQK